MAQVDILVLVVFLVTQDSVAFLATLALVEYLVTLGLVAFLAILVSAAYLALAVDQDILDLVELVFLATLDLVVSLVIQERELTFQY